MLPAPPVVEGTFGGFLRSARLLAEKLNDVQPVHGRPPVSIAEGLHGRVPDGWLDELLGLVTCRRGLPPHVDRRRGTKPLVVLGKTRRHPEYPVVPRRVRNCRRPGALAVLVGCLPSAGEHVAEAGRVCPVG